LGIALVPFVLASFIAGAICSLIIAQQEGGSMALPNAWLLVRALLAAWFILAVWTAFGATLAALFRGTALAVGIGMLYVLALEGIVSALISQSESLRPWIKGLLRVNADALVKPLTAPV